VSKIIQTYPTHCHWTTVIINKTLGTTTISHMLK
jgi:hypothetical protein